jgi:predicted P-loop ATPase
MKIDIAVGKSRKTTKWKNKQIEWEVLAEKLQKPVRTSETAAEYQNAGKEARAAMKDVGGFVGGFLRQGKRSPQNVAYRQLLALDIDHAGSAEDFWADFQLMFSEEAVLHSTHSHAPGNTRLRLVMPMSREAAPDEYAAFARKIAGVVGIELFDPTTFEPNRLMYWPSIPKDAAYYFRRQEGPWADVDAVLASYEDWRDSSQWPVCESALKSVQRRAEKQEDPTQKDNIVGLFCRVFSVPEAIEEFLQDEYEHAFADRYTYKKGTTAAGLVVYGGVFAYSHHGTDPASGQLCNAFDLVRLHKFGHLDINAQTAGTPRAPSYKEMSDFALSNASVRAAMAREAFKSAEEDFGGAVSLSEAEELGLDWAAELEVTKQGAYKASAKNFSLILKNDPALKGAFMLNLFDNKRYVCRDMPWRKVPQPEPMRNVDYSGVRSYIEKVYGISSAQKVDDAVALELERLSFHPVRDYLNSLQWDGEPRVDTLLIDYFGAGDTPYTREAARKTLAAAAARVFWPGIKFDLVLTLVGDEGTGKSTFISKLGNGWASDTFLTVHGKESFEQLQGAWLVEMAELSGLRKAEVEAIKHYITKQQDTFRPAYARTPETFKRQCVFIGTTNNESFLRGATGNRRFIPVDVDRRQASKSVFSITQQEVDQIWAEAVQIWRSGEKLYMSEEASKIALAEQAGHSTEDERRGLILDYLEVPLPEGWRSYSLEERKMYLEERPEKPGAKQRQTVCVAEIWCECLLKSRSEMTNYKTREINDILRSLPGWQQAKTAKRFKLYGPQKYYERIRENA